MFKVNNKDTRTKPSAFKPCSSVSIDNFLQVNAGWEGLPPFVGQSFRKLLSYEKICDFSV